MVCAVSLAWPTLVVAVEPPPEPVPVGGFTLPPAGNLEFSEGRFVVHPKALVGCGWNSEVDGQADAYGRGIIGTVVRYLPNPLWDGTLDGEFEGLRYRRVDDQDAHIGRLVLQVDHHAATGEDRFRGGWVRTQDALLVSGEQVVRDVAGTDLRMRRGDEAGWWQGDGVWELTDYQEATSLFGANEADHQRITAGLRIGYGGRREAGCDVGASVEGVRYAQSTRYNDCRALRSTAGISWPLGGRSLLRAEGGVEMRRYADDYLGDPASDDRMVVWPVGDLGATWGWSDESEGQLRAVSRVADSLVANAETSLGIEGIIRWRFDEDTRLEGSAGVFHDRDSGAPAGVEPVRRTVDRGRVSVVRTIARGLGLRLFCEGTRVTSDPGDGYDRLVVAADLAYTY